MIRRLEFYAVAALVALVLAFCAGWMVNGWRLESSHQKEMRAAEKYLSDLLAAIASQTASIQIAAAESAESRRVASIAQEHARQARAELKRAKAASTCQEGALQLWQSVQ